MKIAPLAFGLLLGGCAATAAPPAPTASTSAYLALGQEPGWSLEITADQLRYTGDYGAVKIAEPNPGARTSSDSRSYAGTRLAVTITPGPCTDTMSGRRFAEKVIVVADLKTVSGCGGALLPPANLVGSLWRFTHIGGTPVADEGRTELRFAEGQLSGSAGCNRFTGGYQLAGSTLTPGALAGTRMACMGPAAEQESRFFALMGGSVTMDFAPDGAMMLTGANGMTARLVLRP